ncbi:MAG: bifunctional (p)ppGpp synthetase/guanosine-3',5'-bis(diphosphate) 3'-pyrophosphohydrolase [Rikenellaceae bacterium]|nr:bifunctional (p)ppGpp synthetase/guanosine-3',5'-bis(diphosphate) 3'-pyrophosphohydrolase [Rikenellaceae bacterium]
MREHFMNAIREHFSIKSYEMIGQALALADEKLAGRTRYDGSPLLGHSVGTALIVTREIGLGRNSTISTLLHDVVRLGLMTPEEVGALYGEPCIDIIKGLCNISDVDPKMSHEQADNFRELIVSYSTDPRVILIKLADRLEVMRSLDIFPPQKRDKKAWESLNLYAQIAHKLGLYNLKSELEDLSLRQLEPADYTMIERKLRETASERTEFIAAFLRPIEEKLAQTKIKYHIKSRTKSIYSIWRKMQRTGIPFEEVYDIFALRIIIDCKREEEKAQCWGVYSVITDFYTPNPDRMRDWISIPKSNGYESLHTTVVTPEGRWVEIQIRSERMDAVAERGIAAHWRYKGVNQGGMGSEEWLGRLRELIENTEGHALASKFDAKLSSDEIFVFTPNGDLRKLPAGATVLDFAYEIHTNLGATCTGGKINHRVVPLKEELHNGDIVEILSSKNQKPKSDWLSIARTNRARSKIKAFLREELAKAANLGREELERKVKNWKLPLTIDDAVTVLCKYHKLKTGTELYGQIAQQKIDLADVKDVLTRHLNNELPVNTRMPSSATKASARVDDALVIDDKLSGIDYKLAKCCNPIFGDDIFGFTTVSAGITIHRTDCPNAARLIARYPYRVLPARWRDDATAGAFRATLRIQADDATGMVNKIAEVINRDLKINIRSMALSSAGGTLSGLVNIEVTSTQIVDMVIYTLLRIKGVQRVYRVNN